MEIRYEMASGGGDISAPEDVLAEVRIRLGNGRKRGTLPSVNYPRINPIRRVYSDFPDGEDNRGMLFYALGDDSIIISCRNRFDLASILQRVGFSKEFLLGAGIEKAFFSSHVRKLDLRPDTNPSIKPRRTKPKLEL